MDSTGSLSLLGNANSKIPDTPTADILETFENKAGDILVPFLCNEFTSLCPMTGQPDFAKFEILYIPDKTCIESKSLKFYLFSYRTHGVFHETVTRLIAADIIQKIKPKFLRVWGDFAVRGGISIKPLVVEWDKTISSEDKERFQDMIEHWDRLRYFDR